MSLSFADAGAVCVGFLLSSIFLFAPGYTFGWLSNAIGFRRRTLAMRLASSVPLSIAIAPILTDHLWRWWSPLAWGAYGVCAIACIVLLVRDLRVNRLSLSRSGRVVTAIAVGWVILGTLSLIDIQIGDRLYFPVAAYDYSTRAAFTAALSRTGIPPVNPYFFPGHGYPIRYHYFWMIPCSLVDQLGGTLVSARQAIIAGTLWCGLGLFSIIALYLRFFSPKGAERIESRTLFTIALLGITGLDLLPVLAVSAASGRLPATIEWWNDQISAWVTTLLWVPHHLAALIACLTGFLLIWVAPQSDRRFRGAPEIVAGGLAFASAAGLSIYVTCGFAAGLAVWLAIVLAKRWWRDAAILGISGLVALAAAAPYLLSLSGAAGTKASVIVFSIRSTSFSNLFAALWPGAFRSTAISNLILLPLNYFFEFGFFFVVGVLYVNQLRREGFRDKSRLCAFSLLIGALIVCTFLRSALTGANDMGWRSALVVQFVLLLWTTELRDRGKLRFLSDRIGKAARSIHLSRPLLALTLTIGVLGSLGEIWLQRCFPILSDSLPVRQYVWLTTFNRPGRRMLELRRTYETLDGMLPATAIVQHNPAKEIWDLGAAYYSGRQEAADAGDCNIVFGGSREECTSVLRRLNYVFDSQQGVTINEVRSVCRELSITALIARDTDPAWQDKSSWVWQAQPLVSGRFVRAIRCGPDGD